MTISRLDRLELDIDTRMHDLWQMLWADFPHLCNDATPALREEVAVFMRAAYGKGYCDALKDKGALHREHGYRLPPP